MAYPPTPMKCTENASSRLKNNCATIAAILCAATTGLLATEYPDMKRLVPVPADQPIPIFDFIRPPLFGQVQLNHTGTTVGAIVPGNADMRSLVTYNLTTQLLDGVSAPQGDQEISSFEWLDGDRLAYLDTFGKAENVGVLFLSSAGKLGEAETMSALGSGGGVTQLLGNTPEDRSQFLVNLKGFSFRYDHPELINAKAHGALITRYPELKTDHGFNINFWPNKVGLLEFGITQEDGILALDHLEGDNWVKSPIDVDQIDVFDAGDNPGEFVGLGQRDGNAPRPLEFFDVATGQPKDVILQDKGYDFYGRLYRDPLSHNIVGASYDRAAPHVVWFTQAYRDLQKLLDGLFPNQVVRIVDMDDAGKVVLISSWSDRQPAVYSWVNLETHKSGLIKNSAPWIDPKRMRPMGIIKFETAEGRQMDAYITLPAGASKKNPPAMVVIPRTTSNGRATWGFDFEVQWFASRGYAVLQPNHRGSNGYGWMYPEIEDWDFRKMSDDMAAAVKKAVSMGLVDGSRVAIVGNNFGGFLAAEGVAFEPGVYKCAVSISSYYDFGRYIKEDNYQKFSDPTYSRYLYKLGDPSKDPAKFNAFSPLANAGQIHSPMLIAWGERDDPELRSQSSDMASALEHNGVHSETLYYLNDGQSIRYLDHQSDLNQHIEAFLQKNL
jgi:dienelactone hydrolase